eukprot:8304613-Alexandrium_andersonii.AAC.1
MDDRPDSVGRPLRPLAPVDEPLVHDGLGQRLRPIEQHIDRLFGHRSRRVLQRQGDVGRPGEAHGASDRLARGGHG